MSLTPNGEEANHKHRVADSSDAETQCRPEQERHQGIQEGRTIVASKGHEGEMSDDPQSAQHECRFRVAGPWLVQPRAGDVDPAQNGRCQSQQSQSLSEKANFPAEAVTTSDCGGAERGDRHRGKNNGEERIFRQCLDAMQAWLATKRPTHAEGGYKNLNRVSEQKQQRGAHRKTYAEVVKREPCQSRHQK